MADAVYTSAREAFLLGDIDYGADTIKVVAVDTADYTFSAAHDFLSDVPGAARVATATLAGKTSTNGVADATDTTLTGVTGDEFEALIIYKDTGVEGTSQLICYLDSYTGLPLTPNTGDVTIIWPSGANKIFKI